MPGSWYASRTTPGCDCGTSPRCCGTPSAVPTKSSGEVLEILVEKRPQTSRRRPPLTKYVQKPAGWWQDSKGRMQPPGSFLDPSLRVPPELPSNAADVDLRRDGSAALSSRCVVMPRDDPTLLEPASTLDRLRIRAKRPPVASDGGGRVTR